MAIVGINRIKDKEETDGIKIVKETKDKEETIGTIPIKNIMEMNGVSKTKEETIGITRIKTMVVIGLHSRVKVVHGTSKIRVTIGCMVHKDNQKDKAGLTLKVALFTDAEYLIIYSCINNTIKVMC